MFRDSRHRRIARRAGLLFVTVAAAATFAGRAAAQCTLLSAPVSFEPSPPGAARLGSLNAGYNTSLELFRSSGQARILMIESFGYSVLDISSNPMSPYALLYDDMRFDGVEAHGDGQTYIASLGVSDDGQRAAFSIIGPGTPPWGTVVGQPSGNSFTPLGGDYGMPGANGGTVVQHVGSRYISYGLAGAVLAVADVTSLPSLTPGNIPSERVPGVPGGSSLTLAGNKVIVTGTGSGTIVIDSSNPGPPGNISSGLSQVLVTPGDWGMGTDASWVSAAADPADPTKTWLLAEFGTSPPTYKLMSVQGGTKTVNPRAYQIPGQPGDTWYPALASGLVPSSNGLVALMWAQRRAPSVATQLHTAPVSAWSSSSFGVIDMTSVNIPMRPLKGIAGAGSTVYTYTATGGRAYVIPLNCIAGNAPATSSMTVSAYGSNLTDGATVFLGDTVTVTPTIVPSPSATPLSGFGWNFDFDFHSGVAADDNGTSPRIKNPDNGQFGNPATPPATITLVGPCDPTAGGVPASGTGCWGSVKTNTATGGADFTGAEPPGTAKALKLGLEANNAYGSGGVGTFTLNWKVPAVRLASTQVLMGNPIVSGAEGHPSASGFKWYFGGIGALPPSLPPSNETLVLDASCTGPSCNHAFPARGTYNVFHSATYANGYATPDWVQGTTTPMTVTVSDFVPSFQVNGASAPPVTVLANQTFTITNQSTHGAVLNVAYYYCISAVGSPCTPSTQLLIGDTLDATAQIPAPAVGSWWLHLRANYTNGVATFMDWTPTISGVSDPTAFPFTVTNVIPTIKVYVNSVDVCAGGAGPGGGGCVPGSIDVFTGDGLTAYSYIGTQRDAVTAITWTFPGASPNVGSGQGAVFSYPTPGTYTITLNGYSSPITYNVNVAQRTAALSVSATVSQNPMTLGQPASFFCSASGGTGSYTSYSWNFGDGQTGVGQSTTHSYTANGSFQARCTVQDSGGNSGSGIVNISVGSGGGSGSCSALYARLLNPSGIPQYPDPTYGFSVPAGETWTFDAPAGFTGYVWSFGDGQTSTLRSAAHAYAYAVSTTVTLSVNGCSTLSYPMTVTGAGGGGPPSSACTGLDFDIQKNGVSVYVSTQVGSGYEAGLGDSLTFLIKPSYVVQPGYTVTWDFGDNSTGDTGTPVTHRYVVGGAYTVKATVSNGSTNCVQSYPIQIDGPTADFTVRYEDNSLFVPTKIQGYKTLMFTASDSPAAVDSYDWDFGDGTNHASGQTATHAYNPGSFSAKLTISRGGFPVSRTTSLTVVAPPEPPKWVVPGMAYVVGQVAGTVWQSDVTLMNPDPSRTATYSVSFLDARNPVDDIGKLVWTQLAIQPLGSLSTGNLLYDVFRQPLGSYGALIIRGDVAPLPPIVTARTFNGGDATKGTFGLSVPAASVTAGVTSQASTAASVLIGLRQNDSAYTNLGFVNLRNDWVTLALDFVDARSGAALGTLDKVQLNPYQSLQISRALLAAAGADATSDLYFVKVRILQGSAVYPYATVIDQASTDPIVVTPADSPSNTYRVPGLVRLPGAGGELWRSRFTLGNPSATARTIHLKYSYIPCDTSCRSRVTVEGDVALGGGTSASVDDFVSFWLPAFAGIPVADTTSYQASYLDVAPAAGDPNQEPLLVLGETYDATPSGNVGLQIPGYTVADGASRTGANKRLVLAGLSSAAGFRSNLALVVVGGATGKWCSVHVYSPQGTKLRDIPVQVDGVTQVSDATLFGGIPGDRNRLSVVIDNFDDGTTIGAYATVIDNTSGDATFVKAQPVP